MAKFLKLGEDPRGEAWTLPEDTDVAGLRADLAHAMAAGESVSVVVRIAANQLAELVINGRATPAVLLWEEPESSKPTFTMID